MVSALQKSDWYDSLRKFGLSPFKAAEVALDAARGDAYALSWIDMAQKFYAKEPNP